MLTVIDERCIYFIRNNDEILLYDICCQCFKFFTGIYHTARVVWRIEEQHAGLIGDESIYELGWHVKRGWFVRRHSDRSAASRSHLFCVAHPVRYRSEYFLPGVQGGLAPLG